MLCQLPPIPAGSDPLRTLEYRHVSQCANESSPPWPSPPSIGLRDRPKEHRQPSLGVGRRRQQRAMVAASDVATLERLAHPSLRINAPGGRVLTREQFLTNMRSGEIAAERFERTPEDVSISGKIGIIMGRAMFTPAASSELGRTFGSKPLQRRYANGYLWQQGRWLWLARHANGLPAKP